MNNPSSIQPLSDAERIAQVKARYCRFIDTKQWDRLRHLFTPDARFEGLGSAPSGADLSTFVKGVENRLRDAVSVHHCHMPDIVFTDSETARAIWAMMDYVEWPIGVNVVEAPGHRGFYGYGHYEEEYLRIDGDWKISFLRLTRLRIDPILPSHPLPRPGRLSASRDWLP